MVESGVNDQIEQEGDRSKPLEQEEYDLDEKVSMYCIDCREEVSNWDRGAMYLCYYCSDMDLCEPCYRRKLDRDSGKAPPYWCRLCPKGHKHVRAPVEGWKGMKNGFMEIEKDGVVQRIKFYDWLTEVKETGWPEVWLQYWADMS